MKFKANLTRVTAMAGLAAVLLAACGGGDQAETFAPNRMIAFGDETSLVNPDGTKYTVNGVVFDTTVSPSVPRSPTELECVSNYVWAQTLVTSYGFGFSGRCPTVGLNLNGLMLAANGARAGDIAGQVDSFLATNTFTRKDLVSVIAGANDVIALYESVPDPVASRDALVAAARIAGNEVGNQVVRITDRGAKVIVSTIIDVGLTPYARAQDVANPGRAALLTTLSTQFNISLRLKLEDVRDGGHAVGLILTDELVQAVNRFPSLYGIVNTTDAACAVALPACNATTLTAAAQATLGYGGDWLWADDRHLAQNVQARMGNLAQSRARNNPF